MKNWNTQKSAELYGVNKWGKDYFSINQKGHLEVSPKQSADDQNTNHRLDLFHLMKDLCERGIRLPILLRFPDIINERVRLINTCFNNSIQEYGYQGEYRGVYPIKVNQQRHLVQDIVQFGREFKMGLECGSKPELLIALAMLDTEGALLICNGFKDMEYIETALLSQRLGRTTIIVVDRIDELEMIIQASKKLNIKPKIGFRAKINTRIGGRWAETTGSKSKFGLTPSEMVYGIKKLKQEDMLSSLELLHFHIGSQVPSIQFIKASIKEAVRYYTELCDLGANLQYIDVGGGLGIDYDGSNTSDSSTNYDEQEYANDVVSIIQSACDEKGVPHPNIVSESGRSLVAHSSALIFNVLGWNQHSREKTIAKPSGKDSRLVQDLFEILEMLNLSNLNECYNDIIEKQRDILQLFSYGVLTLEQRAKADDIYWCIVTRMVDLARGQSEFEEIYWKLEQQLSDIYFCNFSVFQSLPDSWALGQLFPVMPIHRLEETPSRRAILADLTCDSDGKIETFIDTEEHAQQNYLEVHPLKEEDPYYLGVFLTGAYQEILGDLHNLFGDTDAVYVTIRDDRYCINHVVEGDAVSTVLNYVEYHRHELCESIRKASEASIEKNQITRAEARLLMRHYEDGLSGYTYLEGDEYS